jgi:lipoprotein NlpD
LVRLGWIRLLFGLLPLVLLGCSSAARAPVGDYSERPRWNPGVHTVRAGETLYSIAWQYGYDYQSLARWNGIRAPYTIRVGQRLRVKPPARSTPPPGPPPARTRSSSRPAAPVASRSASAKPAPQAPASRPTAASPVARAPAPKPSSAEAKSAGPLRWRWPVEGPLVRRFKAAEPGKKGINIAGRIGQPVRAAAPGTVVYAGSGLVGYGRLIIVKHNKQYLSAYGHNQKLIATEGMEVEAGQVIAHMGNSGTNRTQLHFEIRRDGKPVDPLRYLPKR